MKALVIEAFPLKGRRLIEASAGTGKTYTISGLYLRLLLERKLAVTEILVVTFTEAATQELRGRIRQRLFDALRWLEGKREKDDFSAMLQPYRGNREVIQQLRDALIHIDEAAIFTIHGFCQRILTDSAFESGVLFDVDFITDESEIRLQIARDFWRKRVVDSEEREVTWIATQWHTPEILFIDIKALVDNPDIKILPDISNTNISQLKQRKIECFDHVRTAWISVRDEVYELLSDSPVLKRAVNMFRQDKIDALFESMNEFVSSEETPDSLPENFELLTLSKISDPSSHKKVAIKKGQPLPAHPFFTLADELVQTHTAFERARRVHFMLEAAAYMRDEITRRKDKRRIMFFDDLLSKLDCALSGVEGDELAAHIRQQYPVAMVDEFQDTDPLQYHIFHRIYQNNPACGLFMIGDPKQAIYSFRGADVFTYMQARQDTDTATGHFTLKTNYRSHTALVNGVNAIFARASAQFIYEDDIKFDPVEAAGKADDEPLLIAEEPPSPLVCWHVPLTEENGYRGTIPKKWANIHVSRGCAAEITRLLNLGQRREAKLGVRNLAAQDIAVLVRDRFEAASIRSALTEQGIASVYISRDSVFETEEARDLTHLLRSISEPTNATLMRTAMATRLLGMTASEIQELHEDELAWDDKVLAFQHYHKLWIRHGFMPMLHTLLRQERVIARLLSLTDGDRRMTNLLQLAELAQMAALSHPGIENLLRWLADERSDPDGMAEEQQLRMESDENLLQIVTIHKSKGLEYPIVFLPFIWGSKEVKETSVVTYHDEWERKLLADLGSADRESALLMANKERLAEELRLLYVALTRAIYRCYFSWGQFNGAASSAIAYLLHQQADQETGAPVCNMQDLDDNAIQRDLMLINENGNTYLSVEQLPVYGAPFMPADEQVRQPAPLNFGGNAKQSWRMTSFSGLTVDSSRGEAYPLELPDHDQQIGGEREARMQPEGLSPFTFPRGALTGLFLHHLFENIDFPIAQGEVLTSAVAKGLEQYGIDQKWHDMVVDWVTAILDTPLTEAGDLTLRSVEESKRFVELEFHFPLKTMDADNVNRLLIKQRGAGRQLASLDFSTISGMMKGFIDLIFEHEGRFYVLDYKSNYLGDRFEDYRPDKLKQAIDEHYYDLQYLIYTLALHRYLGNRLPGYDYEQHFGGVYYLFLRGMRRENGNKTGVFYDRPSQALIEAMNHLFSGMAQKMIGA